MDKDMLAWHPGFQAALQIELMEDKDALQFEKEYNLTENPLRIDTLIIKVKPGRVIRKSIGKLFRQYNVVEYKSPEDYISINDFYRVMGYASIFQSNTEKVREIPPEELTVTFAANHYPIKLMRYLEETYGAVIKQAAPGIYYITGLLFPMQFLHLRKLERQEYVWLSRLRADLENEDVEFLSQEYLQRSGNPMYGAVMDLLVRANQEKYEEGKQMCDAIRELFADEFAEQEKKLTEQKKQLTEQEKQLTEQEKKITEKEEQLTEQKKQLTEIKKQYQKLETEAKQEKDNGIRVLVETCRELGLSSEDTVTKVMEKFFQTCEAAEQAVRLYW